MDYVGSVGLLVILFFLVAQIIGLFVIVYLGARLAIRHERRLETGRPGIR